MKCISQAADVNQLIDTSNKVYYLYTHQKKKLIACSFAYFEMTRWCTGKAHNYTDQKSYSPIFKIFRKNEEFYFWASVVLHYINKAHCEYALLLEMA